MITKDVAEKILETYKQAWIKQDVAKILSIFTQDAEYKERAFEKPHKGHKGIASYWQDKVCDEQSNITFKLLNYYVIDNVLIAEWDASFDSNIKKHRTRIKEVAIMEIKEGKISSLREYWQSKKVD